MDRSSVTILISLFVWLAAVTSFLVMTRYLITKLTGLFHERMRGAMESAEHIIRTGRAPSEWSRAVVALDPWPYHLGTLVGIAPKSSKDPKCLYLRRLELLIGFFGESSFVQGTDTRDILLSELRTRHTEWLEADSRIFLSEGDSDQSLPTSHLHEGHKP